MFSLPSSSFTLIIRASKEKTYPITVSLSDTVLQLKERVALVSSIPSDRIRLIFSGRVLKDTHSIENYKLSHENIVHMVRSSPPTTKRFDNCDRHGMDTDIMGQMMQDPTFAQFMSSMLQNPQILESMIATNPVLQTMLGANMHAILRSPRFLQMIGNPDMLRQIAQADVNTLSAQLTNFSNPRSNSVVNTDTHSTGTIGTISTTATTVSTPGSAIHPNVQGARFPSSLIAANAPEKRFQVQLQQLSEMGFWDPIKNMRALQVSEGDINSAIEILCSRMCSSK
ncbi:hypothetical protein FBU30_011252 [Linnemannia zychae]|nr:hypothetical protein FBU30_011252 [Linnemannia zychae]